MADWKAKLGKLKKERYRARGLRIELPSKFSFKHSDNILFEDVLAFFDWSYKNQPITIDFSKCKSPNYQALTLLVLYVWKLRQQGCRITFDLDNNISGASEMWRLMGAQSLFHVSVKEDEQFRSNIYKPLLGIRNSDDFKNAMGTLDSYTQDFDVEYMNTLRYVLSELLYNTMEHGQSHFYWRRQRKILPSLFQFVWYQNNNEISFIVCDLGIGIKKHLEQSGTAFESDKDAILQAIRPQVSGTFGRNDPYKNKDNAGMGLFISSNIVRRLKADMHIVSGNGVVHVSPRDITSKTLKVEWPGTFILVRVSIDQTVKFELQSMMREFRESAVKEISKRDAAANNETFYFGIVNFFGPFADEKQAAINFRDNKLVPAIKSGKKVLIDFEGVDSSPHSFLSALLATPVKILGINSYKVIRITNASPEIRETIDYIFDENTE